MKRILHILIVFSAFAVSAPAQKILSVYTSLSNKACKVLKPDRSDGSEYRGLCPGVGGYKLKLYEGDLRQTIDVNAPNGRDYALEFGSIVTSAFSAVGEKAEWRVGGAGRNLKPFALIVRLNANENPEKSEATVSYLVVVKISKNSACITDIVEPAVQNQNAKARELADASAAKPCKASK